MYHYVTDESPMDLNSFLRNFTVEERKRIMFLDGITKSLGGSNIRVNAIAPGMILTDMLLSMPQAAQLGLTKEKVEAILAEVNKQIKAES